MRKRVATLLGGALLAVMLMAPAAHADHEGTHKATPDPTETADLPGCRGNINAIFNHGSGVHDHGMDSKGPGYYFRDGHAMKVAKSGVRADFCG